jgi:hypothetical protein
MTRIFLLAFLICTFQAASAQERRHPPTPVGLLNPGVVHRGALPEQTVRIQGLKAVMLGGKVDSVDGPETRSYRDYLKRVAGVLRARGVQVTEIYSPTSAGAIEKAVEGSHFIFYAGHGIGSNNPPSYRGNITPAGMLVVKDVWTGANDVARWKPARGALVFFLGACFTAGNAGDDMGKIQDAEAKRRIAVYSAPFFTSNQFGGYYATWSDHTAQNIVAHLFAGKTLGQAYDPEGRMDGVFKSAHPASASHELWYHRTTRGSGPVFDYSFAGKSGQTLAQLFQNSETTDTSQTEETDTTPLQPQVTPEQAKRNGILVIRAIYDGQEEEAARLLKIGADTTVRHGDWTPLMLAVYYNRNAVVRALVAAKADLNAEMNGWTALSLAAAYNRTEAADILRKAGAKTERSIPAGKPEAPGRLP